MKKLLLLCLLASILQASPSPTSGHKVIIDYGPVQTVQHFNWRLWLFPYWP